MSKKSRATRAHERPCHTYWGSHGCKKQAGHAGEHVCTCKARQPIDDRREREDLTCVR